MVDLSSPAEVMRLLGEIERDLAECQNDYEAAALSWYLTRREVGRVKAEALLSAQDGSVTEKRARAELAAYDVEGAEWEAKFESLKAFIGVLSTRAMICQSLLKAQGRV